MFSVFLCEIANMQTIFLMPFQEPVLEFATTYSCIALLPHSQTLMVCPMKVNSSDEQAKQSTFSHDQKKVFV